MNEIINNPVVANEVNNSNSNNNMNTLLSGKSSGRLL